MFSLYTSAFNILDQKFDYESALENFCQFAEEVVIAINKSKDDTLEAIKAFKHKTGYNLKIIETDFAYTDPLLDGKIKNAALQNCSNPWLLQLDLDERMILSQRSKWIILAQELYQQNQFDAYLIPSLDLWNSMENIRFDEQKNIGFKWRLHKTGLMRGAVKWAQTLDGHVDISKSDTCELLYPDYSLVRAKTLINLDKNGGLQSYLNYLKENVYTLHLGYVDFTNRIHRNKTFWQKHWSIESGTQATIPMNESELYFPTFKHNLPLE